MAENIREFLVSYGFAVDTAGMSRTESATKAAEDRVTAANAAALNKRIAAEKTAQTERIRTAIAAGEQLTADDRRFVLEQEKNRVAAADAERKRRLEDAKQGRQQREDTLKEIRATALKVTGVVAGIAAAVQGAAGGILFATDRAAKAFERLNYAGQASGTTANGINAFSYAISQLGGTADAAQASLNAFGSNLQKYEAFEGVLKSMGIVTRDTNGHLRDSSQLLTEYLQKLGAMPRAQREAVASAWGIDESTVQAGIRPELRSRIAEYNRDQGAIGADPNSAAAGGTAFQQAMRHVTDLIDAIKTKVADVLFRIITPQLDQVANWLRDNGKTVSDVITALAGGISRLEASFVEAVAGNGTVKDAMAVIAKALIDFGNYIGSDDFKKTVKGFASDVVALAKAFRSALEWLGILPSRAGDAVVPNPTGSGADGDGAGSGGGFGASLRNRRGSSRRSTDVDAVGGKLAGFGGGDSSHVSSSGKMGDLSRNPNATKENADAIKAAAKDLGTTPEDLATVIGYETGGSFSPSKWGGKGGNYMGLIQFGPNERKQYGADQNQTFPQQMEAVKRYLKGRGFKPGMGLLDLYSTINAGSPGHYNASDGNGTVRSHVANMERGMAPTARAFLARGSQDAAPTQPAGAAASSGAPSEGDYKAAQARSDALQAPGHRMTEAERDQLAKDDQTIDAHWAAVRAAGVKPMPHVAEEDFGVKPGPEVKDGRGRLKRSHMETYDTKGNNGPISTTDYRDPALVAAQQKAEADQAHRHHMNELIVRAAHHGMLNPFLHGKALGDTEALRRSIHNSIKKESNVTHNPTFNIHTSDVRAGVDAARMVADRGNRDLIRNVQGMEA